jgi:hypothetical protein
VLGASEMDSPDDLIPLNRELRALAAAVCKEAEERRATLIANRERSLDLLPRVRATRSMSAAIRMWGWRHHSMDSAVERSSSGSSSAAGSQDADG